MRLPVNHFVPLAALILLPACGAIGGGRADSLPAAPTSGPAADYPVVIGEPFTIGTTSYTPADTLNYDAVGYASVSQNPATNINAAHKTLPLPSYAEVTHLESGRTILVRIESRGPMVNDRLIELSQGAAIQLGVGPGGAPVRVRRVNPPEPERAMLRSGGEAPERMETPKALLQVLKRKLDAQEPLGTPSAPPQPPELATPQAPEPAPAPQPVPQPAPVASAPSAGNPLPAPTQRGDLVVQVAAFSSKANADRAARQIGGFITKPGAYWYVRLGPFETQADARAALENARSAGYSDARIQRAE